MGPQGSSSTSKKVLGRISSPLASQKLRIGPIESSRRDLAFLFFRVFCSWCYFFLLFLLCFSPRGWGLLPRRNSTPTALGLVWPPKRNLVVEFPTPGWVLLRIPWNAELFEKKCLTYSYGPSGFATRPFSIRYVCDRLN